MLEFEDYLVFMRKYGVTELTIAGTRDKPGYRIVMPIAEDLSKAKPELVGEPLGEFYPLYEVPK